MGAYRSVFWMIKYRPLNKRADTYRATLFGEPMVYRTRRDAINGMASFRAETNARAVKVKIVEVTDD